MPRSAAAVLSAVDSAVVRRVLNSSSTIHCRRHYHRATASSFASPASSPSAVLLSPCSRRSSHRFLHGRPCLSAPSASLFVTLRRSVSSAALQRSSYGAMLLDHAVHNVANGIMTQDDYYLHGLPPPKFRIDARIAPLAPFTATAAAAATDTFTSSAAAAPVSSTSSPASSSASSSGLLRSVLSAHSHIDPFKCVEFDLQHTSTSLQQAIGSDHPLLNQIAQYLFKVSGKRIRPAIVLLMARGLKRGLQDDDNTNGHAATAATARSATNGSSEGTVNGSATLSSVYRDGLDDILDSQQRLSEIAELIHTSSLLHDDVIDESELRRGQPSVNAAFGNKFAILGGDFLLSRASLALARLRNHEVTELMSMIIEHLVKGEILQLKATTICSPTAPTAAASSSSSSIFSSSSSSSSALSSLGSFWPSSSPSFPLSDHISVYLTKTYYKTASLIANSCHSCALLAFGSTAPSAASAALASSVAYEYGRWLGLCFQVVDDVLDCVGDVRVMGKEGGWDLSHGVVTAPVLYAMDADAELRGLIAAGRASSTANQQDRAEVRQRILESGGVERARQLAEQCAESAVAAALQLKPSVARSALIALVKYVLERNK